MFKFLWRTAFARPVVHVPNTFLHHGQSAYERVKELVELGERHPGTAGHTQTQELILSHLKPLNCKVETVPFVAETPLGPMAMSNIIAKFGSANGALSVVSGHFDTIRPACVNQVGRKARIMRSWRKILRKPWPARDGSTFAGANDGGSSTTLLMEMATILDQRADLKNVWIVFFDGEEALVEWKEGDQTYGSRHQVRLWKNDGTLARIRSLINLDMVGAAEFEAMYELASTASLRDQTWKLAHRLGYGSYFPTHHRRKIGDDHVPFVLAGVNAVDIIDGEYGPGNGYWHTLEDSPDKLCPQTFAVITHLLTELLAEVSIAADEPSDGRISTD